MNSNNKQGDRAKRARTTIPKESTSYIFKFKSNISVDCTATNRERKVGVRGHAAPMEKLRVEEKIRLQGHPANDITLKQMGIAQKEDKNAPRPSKGE